MAKDLTGATLGKYQIVERLGRGGMADVYRAYQPGMDRYVAIKVMHGHLAEDPSFVERFKREAQSVGMLRHPHIVQVIDFDLQDEDYYMVMEFIRGSTLKSLISERGSLPIPEALDLMIKLADAVAYAHSQGLIHRDIKPANVMMAAPDNPILTDFGIAHIMRASGLTATGMAIGTPAYISPEAGRGEKVDERADIYSLGILLYEMLTGAVPYDADTPYAVILKHINDPLPTPRKVIPDLPESIERIILRALTKNRDDRYQTAAELRDAMIQARSALPATAAQTAASARTPAPQPPRTGHGPTIVEPTVVDTVPPRRNLPILAGVLVLVVVVIVVGAVVLGNRPGSTPTPTTQPGAALLPTQPTATAAVPAKPTITTMPISVPTAAATVSPTSTKAPAPVITQAATGSTGRYDSLTGDVKGLIVQGDFDKALAMVEGALNVDPQSYDLLVLYGRANIESGQDRREKGKTIAETALKLAPDRPEAYIVMAQYYLTANTDKTDENIANLRQGISYLNQAIDRHSTDYYVYWYRARANQGLNSYSGSDTTVPIDQIVGDYEKAAGMSPPDSRFYVDRGDFYLDTWQDYSAAQQSYAHAAALLPQDADIQARLAKTYLLMDQPAKAYDLAVQFIARNKVTDPNVLANSAYLAWAAGQTGQATTWANQALSADKTIVAAVYVQALLAWDAKQYDTALARLDEVDKAGTGSNYTDPFLNQQFNRGLNLDRARILAAAGRTDDAITSYSAAIKDSYESWSRPFVERAKLYIQQGKLDLANQDLQTALHLAQTYEHGDKTVNEVNDLLKQIGGAATESAQ